MATKAAAYYTFFNTFGVPAYPSTSVPDDAKFPYVTYNPVYGSFNDANQFMTADAWVETDSEAEANALAERICQALGNGGVLLQCNDGAIWLMLGDPAYQPTDSGNQRVKRRTINIVADFLASF